MSSFIHTPKHFNSAEAALINIYKRNNYALPEFYALSPVETVNEIKKHFAELKKLNVLTVCLQYADENLNKDIEEQTEIIYQSTEIQPLNIYAVLMALKSIDYQIEIEHLTRLRQLTNEEADALKFLNDAINSLAIAIVTSLPEYDKASAWAL